jgi:hypothetical protein
MSVRFDLICHTCGELLLDADVEYGKPLPACGFCGAEMSKIPCCGSDLFKCALHTWSAGSSAQRNINKKAYNEQVLKMSLELRKKYVLTEPGKI